MAASAVLAQDRFEIQVYDSETAPPLSPGVELHVNTAREEEHFTLEPHLGLAGWAELGGYFQTALAGGSFQYAGVKLRAKLRWPRKLADRLGLAINFELSDLPPRFEGNQYGSEVRPIADFRWERLYLAVNPILAIDLDGTYAGKPQFQPAAKAAVDVARGLSLGGEYYAGLWALASPSQPPFSHRLLAAADWPGRFIDLNVGVGYGWGAEPGFVAKMILGFHPAAP